LFKNKKQESVPLRKILLCLFALLLAASSCFAAEISQPTDEKKVVNTKPTIAILYVNNAKTTYDKELTTKIMTNLDTQLKNYTIIAGDQYIERLNKVGISDITTSERTDIVDAFKGEAIDYVLFVELQPFVRKERITVFTYGIDMTAVMPIKIIDLKNNKYLYNGKLTEFATDSCVFGLVGNKSVSLLALDKILGKMNVIIKDRLPNS